MDYGGKIAGGSVLSESSVEDPPFHSLAFSHGSQQKPRRYLEIPSFKNFPTPTPILFPWPSPLRLGLSLFALSTTNKFPRFLGFYKWINSYFSPFHSNLWVSFLRWISILIGEFNSILHPFFFFIRSTQICQRLL